jgi:Zn-dependent protease with chaperone function
MGHRMPRGWEWVMGVPILVLILVGLVVSLVLYPLQLAWWRMRRPAP